MLRGVGAELRERDDASLLASWQAGDKGSGAVLFERYGPPLIRFFSDKASAVAEDLVQQTFAACVDNLDSIESDGGGRSFRAFVFGVARRRLIDHFRRWSQPTRAFDPLTTSVAALLSGPTSQLDRERRKDKLRDALASLPLDTQLTFELHYWHELTVQEAATVLGVAAGTVKARLSRGRERLREILGDDPFG